MPFNIEYSGKSYKVPSCVIKTASDKATAQLYGKRLCKLKKAIRDYAADAGDILSADDVAKIIEIAMDKLPAGYLKAPPNTPELVQVADVSTSELVQDQIQPKKRKPAKKQEQTNAQDKIELDTPEPMPAPKVVQGQIEECQTAMKQCQIQRCAVDSQGHAQEDCQRIKFGQSRKCAFKC